MGLNTIYINDVNRIKYCIDIIRNKMENICEIFFDRMVEHMRIEALKYRTAEKNDIVIIIEFYETYDLKGCKWDIADIKYKTSRQRNYRYYSDIFSENYEYRHLSVEERRLYSYKKFEEFVGKDKLEEALMAAWESLKPDLDKIINIR